MIPITNVTKPGQIVILNGAPRSGKSSIVTVIQETFAGPWMNLGADVFVREVTPKRYRPGMGLRPGEEDHELAPLVPVFFAALYDSIAAHSRSGLNVVADVGHHDAKVLADSASPSGAAGALRRSPLPDRRRHATAELRSSRKGRAVRGRVAERTHSASGRALATRSPHPGHLRHRGRHFAAHARGMRGRDTTTPRRRGAALSV